MGPKVQGRIWWHLLLGSAAKGAGSAGLPLRCAWPLRARTWRPPERVPARLQGHNGQAIQRPRACAARAAPIIAGVACRAQVLAGSMPDQCGNAKMVASDAYRQWIYEPLL